MKNFYKLAQGMDVTALMAALHVNADLWDENKLRSTHEMSPHQQVSDIWLRFNDLTKIKNAGDVIDEHESINYPAMARLPQARPFIFGLMHTVEGERLGRILITKLSPGGKIDPHEDGGSHASYYERYHIVLNSAPGSIFRCGDETIHMKTGEVWWFNNAIEHEVINNSADDRIHLIVDVKVGKLC